MLTISYWDGLFIYTVYLLWPLVRFFVHTLGGLDLGVHMDQPLYLYEPRHDKTNKVTVHPAKTQISLGIRTVWSESSLSAWRKLGSLATHWAHSEYSDQTGRVPRLIVSSLGAQSLCWFCHVAAHMLWSNLNTPSINKAGMSNLSCTLEETLGISGWLCLLNTNRNWSTSNILLFLWDRWSVILCFSEGLFQYIIIPYLTLHNSRRVSFCGSTDPRWSPCWYGSILPFEVVVKNTFFLALSACGPFASLLRRVRLMSRVIQGTECLDVFNFDGMLALMGASSDFARGGCKLIFLWWN